MRPAHEQRVVEQLAQPRQRMADRRRTEAELAGDGARLAPASSSRNTSSRPPSTFLICRLSNSRID
jgi:hypothetical protein